MKLDKKKQLATRALKVGKNRIMFIDSRLDEIKEAITKQDIRDLKDSGAIVIKDIKGRRKVEKRKRKKGPGKIKQRVNKRKQEYVKITRKLRAYLKQMKAKGSLAQKEYIDLRKKIRARYFKSKSQLKAYIEGERQ